MRAHSHSHSTRDGTAYRLSGNAGAPVVALVHGLGLDRRIWHAHRAALSADYRVLEYDLFGHGDSAPPPATPTLALFSAQLRALLDALDIRACAIVGFSLGGMINRRFAIDHPARVAALAIFNSPHERSEEQQRRVEAGVDSAIADTLDSALERWFTPAFRAARADIIRQTRARLLANDPVVYAKCRGVLAGGVRELIRPQPPIAAPALVMTCEHDRGSTPAMARAIGGEIAGAQVRIVPGLRHLGLVEEPARFTEPLRDFLRRSLP